MASSGARRRPVLFTCRRGTSEAPSAWKEGGKKKREKYCKQAAMLAVLLDAFLERRSAYARNKS